MQGLFIEYIILIFIIVALIMLANKLRIAYPIVLVLGEDRRSVRAFERTVDGRRLEFFQNTSNDLFQLIDKETGTTWNFEGKAISGALAGRQLKKVFVLEDYWFDWRLYHPDTSVYLLG